ncbi:hypothetical protein AK812_SmicGene17800 [Symbiodinium microadriaticum]|uniref:Uncharacterized protein n=1 Tax=Symbiodinium microadriaticum TaxID=2951 RepID=A0A1Q9DWT0_SYMMI|nr:hypothetical protein AK812_SmicGene17800 [Symbiodinium microadriaticum]
MASPSPSSGSLEIGVANLAIPLEDEAGSAMAEPASSHGASDDTAFDGPPMKAPPPTQPWLARGAEVLIPQGTALIPEPTPESFALGWWVPLGASCRPPRGQEDWPTPGSGTVQNNFRYPEVGHWWYLECTKCHQVHMKLKHVEDPQQDHAEGAPGDGAIDHEAQEEPQQEDAEGAPGDGDHAEHQPEQGSAD